MRLNRLKTVSLFVFLTASFSCAADIHRIHSSEELAGICRTVQPGDTVILGNGTYTDQHFNFTGTGSAARPILLRAETPGKVVLNGSSRLSIGGEHLAVDGLLFKDGALKSGSIIEFRAGNQLFARRCVLRNTVIADYNPPKVETRYFWVSLYGSGNVVEECTFSGQNHSGVTLCVRLDKGKAAGHTIRRSHFADRSRGSGNGFETIRIGTSSMSMVEAQCTVSDNLFERCNGEIEIVSNKSCGNVYKRNTFLECSGCLTLRQGNRCRVEGNVFIGGEAQGAGGVRIAGEGHRVVDNFFSGTKGRAGGAVSIHAGMPESPLNGYFQVKNCVIDGNTFVNNPGALFALASGYGSKGCRLLPENVTISNNLMSVPDGAVFMIEAVDAQSGITWENNISVGGISGGDVPAGIKQVSDLPAALKHRLTPEPLTQADAGAGWWTAGRAEQTAMPAR